MSSTSSGRNPPAAGLVAKYRDSFERFLVGTEENDALAAHNRLIQLFNNNIEASGKQLAPLSEAIEASKRTLESLENSLSSARQRPGNESHLVSAVNEQVGKHNAVVQEHNRLIAASKATQEGLNREIESAAKRLDAARHDQEVWKKSNTPNSFWRQLNGAFAEARRQWCEDRSPQAEQRLVEFRQLRADVATWASKNRKVGSKVVVPVDLAGEKAHLLLDTGAMDVTLSLELVRAMQWDALLGEPKEYHLAAGHRAMCPTLRIPRLDVLGHRKTDVSACAAIEDSLGVDGLLGMSFLADFQFTIDCSALEPLKLIPVLARASKPPT